VRVIKVESPTFFWIHLEHGRRDLDEDLTENDEENDEEEISTLAARRNKVG